MLFAENWFLFQYEDQPDTHRVLNEQEVKHLDSGDEDNKKKGDNYGPLVSREKLLRSTTV